MIRHSSDVIQRRPRVISDRRNEIRFPRTSITCMQEGVRVLRVAIRETLARIRSDRPPIRVLPVSIRCMPEDIRVHPVSIRETLARIRSRRPPIRKRRGYVQDKLRGVSVRIEEFCVQGPRGVTKSTLLNRSEVL